MAIKHLFINVVVNMHSYSSMANAKLQKRNIEPEIFDGLLPTFDQFDHRPHIIRKKWTAEEDRMILKMQAMHGNKWTMIMTFLPGRSKHSVRNRWNVITRDKRAALSQSFPTANNEKERHARAFVYATQTIPYVNINELDPRTANVTHKNEEKTYTHANNANAAMKLATSTSHPTSTNERMTSSTKVISATRPLSTVNFKQLPSPIIQKTNNEHQLPSGEFNANPRPIANLNFDILKPTIVVVNLSDIDSTNDNDTPKLSPLPNSATMAIHDAEGELLGDDESVAYAVAFAASLIHADDNSWLCQSITDDDDNF